MQRSASKGSPENVSGRSSEVFSGGVSSESNSIGISIGAIEKSRKAKGGQVRQKGDPQSRELTLEQYPQPPAATWTSPTEWCYFADCTPPRLPPSSSTRTSMGATPSQPYYDAFYKAFEAKDVEAVAALYTPDCEWVRLRWPPPSRRSP